MGDLGPAMEAQAKKFAEAVRQTGGRALTFTPADLRVVDEWLEQFARYEAKRTRTTEHAAALLAAFLGEVFRKTWGGTWEDMEPLGPVLILDSPRLGSHLTMVHPKAGNRFVHGPSESLVMFYRRVAEEGGLPVDDSVPVEPLPEPDPRCAPGSADDEE